MAEPVRKPEDPAVALLLDMQRQLGELAGDLRQKRAASARKRGRRRVYDPDPKALPGPKPGELDIARAKRLWREIR